MRHEDFEIGLEFVTATSRWRCTDLGTRTVIAIKLDRPDDPSWYDGPPYAVAEHVFDEDEVEACWLPGDDPEGGAPPERTSGSAMSAKPTLGELLLGIEGLALLRLAFGEDAQARCARVSEIRSLLAQLEDTPELAAPLEAPEYDLSEGYALWSKTYDSRSGCSRSSIRRCACCSIRSRLRSCSMPPAGPGATASIWPSAGIG